nr:PcfB family protein [uncultured Schaedlerella sp.]
MNLGGEAADQVVRYSLEGIDHGLRLSGTMAKNLAVFLAAVMKNNQKSYGRISMARMLRENRPLKFFTVPSNRIHEFAKEAKKRGLPYVVIRDRKNPKLCELMVFADDAAKVNRVMDQMELDFLKSENGEAVQENVREAERKDPFGNSQEAERTAQPDSTIKTETVELPEGEIQFELSDFEDDFNVGELPGMGRSEMSGYGMDETEMENFTQAQEGRNLSEPSSRSNGISSGQGEQSKKPSVRKELEQIRQEKQEAGKKRDQKDRSRGNGNRRSRKRMKIKEKGR